MGISVKALLPLARGFFVSRKFKQIEGYAYLEGSSRIVGGKHIVAKGNFYAGNGLRLEAISYRDGKEFQPEIIFGKSFAAGENLHIGAINQVVIGDEVLFGSKVYISDHQHGTTSYEDLTIAPDKRELCSKGPVVIEDKVWVGDNVVILDGVTIGHNSIVAANAVVTKSVPPFSVVGGVPAKVIKVVEPGA